jgi:3-oxoacyl-ACP reductase-like protein
MTISLDDIERLKSRVADLEALRERAAGVKQEVMRQIKKEFGCTTLEEAEELLAKLRKKELKLFRQYTEMKAAFEKEFGEALDRESRGD